MKSYKIALVQMRADKDKSVNEDRLYASVSDAAAKGASMICFQEMSSSIYYCKDHYALAEVYAEPVPGPFTTRLSNLALKHQIVIAAPFTEVVLPGVYYNSMVMIDSDGSLLGSYRKMHIPDDPGFHEKYYFRPGDDGYKVFDTAVGKVGVLICWDQWFPEAARITSLKGADIILYPTAIGTLQHESEEERTEFLDAWITIQRSHAIANGVFVASVNRTGVEEGTKFWGNSFVCSPFGKMLMQADEKEGIYYCDIHPHEVLTTRKIWPFLRDRRTDSYGQILQSHLENEG